LGIHALINIWLLSRLTCIWKSLDGVAIVVGLFFLLESYQLFAQSLPSDHVYSDSLLQSIISSKGTKKVDALNEAAEFFHLSSVNTAQPMAEQALSLAGKLHYITGKANALKNLAMIMSNKGENKTAIDLSQSAQDIYNQENEQESEFNCIIIQASNYQSLGDNDKVVETYLQALHLAEEMGRADLQSLAVSLISQFFIKMNDKSNALIYASKAMLLSKIAGIPNISGQAFMSMAIYMSKYGLQRSATEYFRKSLTYFNISKQLYSIAGCYTQFGNHYLALGALDSARAYYLEALRIDIKTNDIMTQASVYTLIAHAYQLDNKLDKALTFQYKALKLRQEYGNVWLTGSSLSNIGAVYTKLGDYQKALEYFHAGLKTAKQLNRTDYIKYNYQRIYELYVEQKNYKKAFKYNLLLSSLNDSILKNKVRRKFAEINYKYEVGQKQQAIEFLSKENEIQKLLMKQTRLTIIVLSISILLILIIVLLLNFQAKLNARHRQMDIEQKLLRSQMNPHFIFNALVAIQSFIYKKESVEAAKYLSSFARLIRLVLSNSREEFVTLKCEIDTLSNYLSLQKLRFENKFDYTIVMDPRLEPELVNVPPMLAQPFIENAIEHGIFGMNGPGRIVIIIHKKDNTILIEVNDNGIGREKGRELRAKSDKSHESLATRITEERISSLNRKYPWKISLSITDLFTDKKEPAGTSVLLSIPLLPILPQ
jgi:tetratricopeptide (TPR) repeat protein